MRIELAKILLSEPDVLLLDEPTNHLDMKTVEWLEDYLRRFRGAIIMITHDRYFLNRVTNRICELDHAKLYFYEENYEGFVARKAERIASAAASERKRQTILRRELEWMRRGAKARLSKSVMPSCVSSIFASYARSSAKSVAAPRKTCCSTVIGSEKSGDCGR